MILEPNQTTSFCCLTSKFSNCFNSLLWSSITCFNCHFLFPPNSPLMPQPFFPFVMKRSHFPAFCWPSFFNIQALSHLWNNSSTALAAENSFTLFSLGFSLNRLSSVPTPVTTNGRYPCYCQDGSVPFALYRTSNNFKLDVCTSLNFLLHLFMCLWWEELCVMAHVWKSGEHLPE